LERKREKEGEKPIAFFSFSHSFVERTEEREKRKKNVFTLK
jgi:hypothetical protein